MSRYRIRAGRRVRYFPTSSEQTDFGEGPYSGVITRVNADGSADLSVDVPPQLTEDLAGTVDGTYAQDPEGDILDGLRTRELLRTKSSITRGSRAGQFDLLAGPSAI